jgi:hypothetical protein
MNSVFLANSRLKPLPQHSASRGSPPDPTPICGSGFSREWGGAVGFWILLAGSQSSAGRGSYRRFVFWLPQHSASSGSPPDPTPTCGSGFSREWGGAVGFWILLAGPQSPAGRAPTGGSCFGCVSLASAFCSFLATYFVVPVALFLPSHLAGSQYD